MAGIQGASPARLWSVPWHLVGPLRLVTGPCLEFSPANTHPSSSLVAGVRPPVRTSVFSVREGPCAQTEVLQEGAGPAAPSCLVAMLSALSPEATGESGLSCEGSEVLV